MTEQQLGYVPHEDMPLYLYMGPLSQQNYDALFKYQQTAGSFASALIQAFWNADGNNRIKLLDAFPWLFVLREDMITDAELWWEQYEQEATTLTPIRSRSPAPTATPTTLTPATDERPHNRTTGGPRPRPERS